MLGIFNVEDEPWPVKNNRWFRGARKSTQKGKIIGLMPVIITWRLWLRRSKARVEEKQTPRDTVCLGVRHWLATIVDGMLGTPLVKIKLTL